MQQHLLNISQRLSVNTLMGDGSITGDELLLKKQYQEYHEPVVKTFSEASESHFFKLLVEHLTEGLGKLPGWSGWILLEYYDDAVNGLRMVLITDKNEDSYCYDVINKLDQENYNFSLLIRAMREFHVHVNGWHFKTTNCDPIYHCENKLSLEIMLPGGSNPYSEKPYQDQHYNAYARPVLISREDEVSKNINHIKQNNGQFTFNSELDAYFKMIEQCRENADAFTNENNQNNHLLKDHPEIMSLIGEFDCNHRVRIEDETSTFIIKDLKQKLDRNIEKILIDKGKIKTLTRKSFEDYCRRLTNCFSDSSQFLYLPAFTTLKKGGEPQRKDLMIGSVMIGVDKNNSFNTEQIHHLWRFVQSELLKWYNQYNSFKLYTSNKRMKQEALLNAITQVFARNESHINGSHVIPHLLKKDTTFDDKLKDIYFEYLKGRMELVGSVQNFPGLLKTITNLDTLIKSFKENKILWEGIIEGKCKFGITEYGITREDFNIAIGGKSEFHLPGAALGEQVFCSLLEGIIRNYVKHNISDTAFVLKIILKIDELHSDDCFSDDYLSLSVYGNVVGNQETVNKINDAIQEKVLDGTKLRGHNLGMLELKAASLLLMDAPLEAIDQFHPETPVKVNGKSYPGCLKADLFKDGDSEVIGYKLYLLIPKLVYTLSDNYERIINILKGIEPKNIVQTKEFDPGIACTFYIGDNDVNSSNFRQIKTIENDCVGLKALWRSWAQEKFPDAIEPILVENDTNIDGSGQIVVDDHGCWKNEHADFDLSKLNFYAALNTEQKAGILRRQNRASTFAVDPDSFIEAALTKIALLDERIQHWADGAKHQNTNMPMIEAYQHMRVYIPEIAEMDLNKPQGELLVKAIKSYYENGCRYVVLHHSIFERLCLDIKGSKDSAVIEEFYHELHQPALGRFLVLVSGLGIPTNLPIESYYCSLSSLEKVVKERPNKYLLVQFLYALRTN